MALTARDAYLRRTYNMTEEQYNALLAFQGGVCATCGEPPKPCKRLHVDHNHVSGLVRGLVCDYDNLRVIGRHKEGRRLRAAADYMDHPPAVAALGAIYAPTATEKRKARAKRARKRATKARTR